MSTETITINQREEEPLKTIIEYRNHNNKSTRRGTINNQSTSTETITINQREEEPLKSINEYRNHNNQSTRRGTIKINH